jgi:predicted nuclease of predicted toxin-antitoxin system
MVARWLVDRYQVEAASLRSLGLRDATDLQIFEAAQQAQACIVTKDIDFVWLMRGRAIPPPYVLWVRCGNTSNAALEVLFASRFAAAKALFEAGEALVELA